MEQEYKEVVKGKQTMQKPKFEGNYNFCGIFGHKLSDCYKKKNQRGKKNFKAKQNKNQHVNFANKNKEQKSAYVCAFYIEFQSYVNEWILDSRYTNHMYFEKDKF